MSISHITHSSFYASRFFEFLQKTRTQAAKLCWFVFFAKIRKIGVPRRVQTANHDSQGIYEFRVLMGFSQTLFLVMDVLLRSKPATEFYDTGLYKSMFSIFCHALYDQQWGGVRRAHMTQNKNATLLVTCFYVTK